jgi:hypothetical protein
LHLGFVVTQAQKIEVIDGQISALTSAGDNSYKELSSCSIIRITVHDGSDLAIIRHTLAQQHLPLIGIRELPNESGDSNRFDILIKNFPESRAWLMKRLDGLEIEELKLADGPFTQSQKMISGAGSVGLRHVCIRFVKSDIRDAAMKILYTALGDIRMQSTVYVDKKPQTFIVQLEERNVLGALKYLIYLPNFDSARSLYERRKKLPAQWELTGLEALKVASGRLWGRYLEEMVRGASERFSLMTLVSLVLTYVSVLIVS